MTREDEDRTSTEGVFRTWSVTSGQMSASSCVILVHFLSNNQQLVLLGWSLTNLDVLEARLGLPVHGSQRHLQDLPGDALTAARLPYQHGRVAGVFGLVELDDLGHGERGHLQAAAPQLRLDDLLQLKRFNTCS